MAVLVRIVFVVGDIKSQFKECFQCQAPALSGVQSATECSVVYEEGYAGFTVFSAVFSQCSDGRIVFVCSSWCAA